MKHFLFSLFFGIALSTTISAATVTWDGGAGTGNWSDAMNWDTDALPTAADDVDLNGATVVLDFNTQVQRVLVDGSGQLTVTATATLTIDGFTGDDEGLEVQTSATCINNGTINISNISGNDGNGLYCKGFVTNNGNISISSIGQHGLYVVANSFTNASGGTITISDVGLDDNNGDNIYTDDANSGSLFSTLTNDGTIIINMNNSDDGIYVNDNSTFINTGSITINVTGASDNGMRIDDGGAFNNNGGTLTVNTTADDQIFLDSDGTFSNAGTLNLNNGGDVGLYVTDQGIFTNTPSGTVNILDNSNYGIQIDGNGSTARIDNNGNMTVTGGNNDGLRLQEKGTFNNNATITFSGNGDEGIQIDDSTTPASTFNNNGTVNINNSNDNATEIYGNFNNSGTLAINTPGDIGLYILSNATFTNNPGGMISINAGSDYGIQIDANGNAATVQNNGSILITGGTVDGIRMQEAATLTNGSTGTMTITNAGDEAIQIDDNLSTSTLTNDGSITINTPTDHGVELYGTIINNGSFSITGAGDNGLYLLNSASFANGTAGTLGITGAMTNGILVDANSNGTSATITNEGSVSLSGSTQDDMRMQEGGTFNNQSTATFTSTTSGDEGIQIDDPAIFNNSGLVDIISSGDHGMELFGTFNNLSNATFQGANCADDGIRIQENGLFANDAAVLIDGSGSEDIETETIASFTNSATATFAPGSSPGDLEIRDDFDLGAATVTFEISGTEATTEYDQILNTVMGNSMTISGATANIEWGSFTPAIGDCFKIVDGSGSIVGTFVSINSSDPLFVFTEDYSSGTEVEICITGIVPVELARFSAEKTSKGSELFWATMTEANNAGFDIERRAGNQEWTKIGFVEGAGNSRELVEYTFLDERPLSGANYYRLKQNDFDGAFEYSKIVSLDFDKDQLDDIAIFPNPASDVLYIQTSEEASDLEVQLLDASGKILSTQSGLKSSQLSLEAFPAGIYYLRLISDKQSRVQKFIKQ